MSGQQHLLTEPDHELLAQLAPDRILLGNGQEASIGPTLERLAPVCSMSIYTGKARPLARARAAARARLTPSHRARPVLLFLFGDDRHGWIADGNGLVQAS